jgi:pilus assembly protein CpaE
VIASAAGEKGTCLLDLDMQSGAAGSLLDLNRISRVEDLIADPSRLDVEMLETLTVRHQSGLRVLTAPRTPQPLEVLDAEGVSQLLRVAKEGNAFTVVDLPMAVTSWTAPVLRAADVIYMVVELSVPIAHRVRRFLDLLQQEGMSRLPLKLVVNRQNSGTKPGRDIAAGKFAKAVGRDIDYAIPNDYDLIALSHSQGRAAVELKPKSAFGKALSVMLSKDLGVDLSPKNTRGLFSFNRR